MTNTAINVPRELLDSLLTVIESNGYAADEVEVVDELRALLSAPSPAGVYGCKGKNCGATDGASHSAECIAEHEQACGRADSNGLPVVAYLIGGEPSLTPCPVRGVVNEPLCRLSDATAIIDGRRGEVAAIKEQSETRWAAYVRESNIRREIEQQLDQQAQRIGELEQILRDLVPGCKWRFMRPRIDAALSAGNEPKQCT